jgi:hypothetical protein
MAALKEKLKATGKVTFKLFDKDGKLKQEKTINNLVVTAGLNWIAARMKETGRPDQMSHMQIGNSSTIASVGQTVLVGPLTPRQALTVAGGTVSGSIVTYSATFPGGGTGINGAITEAGIFNALTGGTMLCRTTFDVINKTADDSLGVSWEVTIN